MRGESNAIKSMSQDIETHLNSFEMFYLSGVWIPNGATPVKVLVYAVTKISCIWCEEGGAKWQMKIPRAGTHLVLLQVLCLNGRSFLATVVWGKRMVQDEWGWSYKRKIRSTKMYLRNVPLATTAWPDVTVGSCRVHIATAWYVGL